MLLTIATTIEPATDLGFLLAKHPERLQTFSLPFGQAHVFYPEVGPRRCEAALLVEADPLELARRARERNSLLAHVNDRPYVASSLMSVAISRVFGSALSGKSRERPELALAEIPLTATVAALPIVGGESFVRSLFEPLGYAVSLTRQPLDAELGWDRSPYYRLTLTKGARLSDLLTHLYVLIPVMDDDKHYWVGDDEVDKLLDKGATWLPDHPEKDEIVARYLKRQRGLTRSALERLVTEEAQPEAADDVEEVSLERPLSLNKQRMQAVEDVLRRHGAKRVLDVGCGEGKLLRRLFGNSFFTRVVGVDVSASVLERAARRLRLDEKSARQRERIALFQASLTYRDERLHGFDAACLVEVIEHVDPPRLEALEYTLFSDASPPLIVVTTPNIEHNVVFGMEPGQLRHRDHRFEWTRRELRNWASAVAERHNYEVTFVGIGDAHPEHGAPTQMAVFSRRGAP